MYHAAYVNMPFHSTVGSLTIRLWKNAPTPLLSYVQAQANKSNKPSLSSYNIFITHNFNLTELHMWYSMKGALFVLA